MLNHFHTRSSCKISSPLGLSASHLGSVLQQQLSGSDDRSPLGFFSKKLSVSQLKWRAFDRELWASFAGIRHLWFILEVRISFTIFIDHKPLTYALSRSTHAWTAKQCWHLSYVAEFTSEIQYIPGQQNLIADTLLNPALPPVGPWLIPQDWLPGPVQLQL